MPGAQPSANPAKREEFEQRCRSSIADIADGAGKKKGNQSSVDESESVWKLGDLTGDGKEIQLWKTQISHCFVVNQELKVIHLSCLTFGNSSSR